MGYRVAVVGATGAVGREMLKTLAERQFPADEVAALASGRSTGSDGRVVVPELEELRRSIDEVDRKLLELMAERARLVLAVGDVKRVRNMAVYDPDRERRVLERLGALAPPPLDATTVQRVFERLIDEMRRLEQSHMSKGRSRVRRELNCLCRA